MENQTTDHQYITLSELTAKIGRALNQGVGGSYWVVAQVGEAKLNYSGHFYMELSQKIEGQTLPVASARAVIWSRTYRMIAPYFRQVTGSDIGAGLQLLLRCSVSFHAVYGLSLVVEDIDPTYTLGYGEMVRQQTIDRLTKEGVVDMNRSLALPLVLQRVAVVSSPTAAGYEDFMNELLGSDIDFKIDLFQAVMQGSGAVGSIIGALESVMASGEDYDAVVVIRGGGSKGDLACFDDYELCANVAQFPLPVISGIGHERDVSALDMVACESRKTPTAVAGMLIDVAHNFLDFLQASFREIEQSADTIVQRESDKLGKCANFLSQKVQRSISEFSAELQALAFELKNSAERMVTTSGRNLDTHLSSIANSAKHTVLVRGQILESLSVGITTGARGIVTTLNHELELLKLQTKGADPRRILSMGYAIIRTPTNGGQALKTINDTQTGQCLEIELTDGRLTTRVEKLTRFQKTITLEKSTDTEKSIDL